MWEVVSVERVTRMVILPSASNNQHQAASGMQQKAPASSHKHGHHQAALVEACHNIPQHALACRCTFFWGLLVRLLKHTAACRSTLKIWLGKKYRPKISLPSLASHLSRMAGTLVVKCVCGWEVSSSNLGNGNLQQPK